MGFQFPFGFIAFFLFFAAVLTLKRFNKTQKLPPGPWKLPVIGSLHHLNGPCPHRSLTTLARKHGPLMHLQLGEISAIVASSPRIAKEMMKTHDLTFSDRPKLLAGEILCYNYGDMGFCPYGDYWKQMRRICFQELFSPKKVRLLGSIRQAEVYRVIASIQSSAGKPLNLTKIIYACINSMISREAFGRVCRDQETFIQLAGEVTKASGGFYIADLCPSLKILQVLTGLKHKLVRVHHKFNRMLDEIIKEHEVDGLRKTMDNVELDSGQEDLVDALLRIKENADLQFPITNKYIKTILFDVFVGGTDSTTTTINWAMSEMTRNPRVMTKAQSELRQAFKGKVRVDENDVDAFRYIKLVIKETLRLHPPGPLLIPRECGQDCEIDGYTIPKGTKAFFNVWAMGRDPNIWQDPDSFVPERFENCPHDFNGNHFEFIPFGSGKRICPGMLLAASHMELLLAGLLYHFNWKLPEGICYSDLDMTESGGAVHLRKYDLHLIPTSYDPTL